MTGDVPFKNWSSAEDPEISSKLSGPTLTEHYLTKAHACSNCPVACKRTICRERRALSGGRRTGPEYETCGTFGTLIMNSDLAAVIKANELCNRYGMDTISAGSAIAVAMELYEKGIINAETADGMKLEWGNMEIP